MGQGFLDLLQGSTEAPPDRCYMGGIHRGKGWSENKGHSVLQREGWSNGQGPQQTGQGLRQMAGGRGLGGILRGRLPVGFDPLPHIDRIGIRPAYFETEWASDFLLRYADGRVGVRELVTAVQLQKKADLEKLELSRRYWVVLDVSDWKVVVIP